jgi:hypothetical protein
MLNGKDEEKEALVKNFATSVKTAVRQTHGPERSRRAEKKQKYSFKDCHRIFKKQWN